MNWHDLVFTAGSICFALALIPSIFGPNKPQVWTCALTAFWLWVFMAVYISLNFTFSAISTAVTALGWTILGYQAYAKR